MVDETAQNDIPEANAGPADLATPDVSFAAELMKQLATRFAVFRDFRPLAIGIHRALLAASPEIDAPVLRMALRRHTAFTRYLKAVATGSARFNLEGQAEGAISDEQKQQAADTLRERFRKGAERKREEEKAKIERERAAAREKEQQAKLQALAAKFSRR